HTRSKRDWSSDVCSSDLTRSEFEAMDAQRTEALVAQFRKEYAQRGEEIVRQVENIANAEITLHTALDAERPNADLSIYVNDANRSEERRVGKECRSVWWV